MSFYTPEEFRANVLVLRSFYQHSLKRPKYLICAYGILSALVCSLTLWPMLGVFPRMMEMAMFITSAICLFALAVMIFLSFAQMSIVKAQSQTLLEVIANEDHETMRELLKKMKLIQQNDRPIHLPVGMDAFLSRTYDEEVFEPQMVHVLEHYGQNLFYRAMGYSAMLWLFTIIVLLLCKLVEVEPFTLTTARFMAGACFFGLNLQLADLFLKHKDHNHCTSVLGGMDKHALRATYEYLCAKYSRIQQGGDNES